MNKVGPPDTGIFVNTKKRNGLLSHRMTWRNFQCMLLSERSQSEKAKHYNSDYMSFCKRQTGGSEKKKKISARQQLTVGRGHVIVGAYKTRGVICLIQ